VARILIIDDDRANSQVLTDHLTKQGHKVAVVHHAGLGVTNAVQSPPDLVIVDLILPDATGAHVCHKLRGNNATKSVPIILMTGLAHNSHQEHFARAMGADEYVSKPLKVITLGEMVDYYVQTKHQPPSLRKAILQINQGFFPPEDKPKESRT
jgi:DNA-binding response OmpR family regulator